MKITPIKTEADYDGALARIERLMDAELNTPRGDELEVLVTLVESYEAKRWAIAPPDPIDAIKLRMEERGLTRRDLSKIVGGSGRVSEILNRKRSLSVAMMRRLRESLDIPAESFLPQVRSVAARNQRSFGARARPTARTTPKASRRRTA